jgi:uncharacterized protein YndB with AHSA1/START domain
MQSAVEAIHKTIVVPCEPAHAFRVFTKEIGSWWPLAMYSIGEDKVTEVVFEEQVGGRIFERHSDGGEGEWGRVLEWEPPHRFVMSWYPGNEPKDATELEVRFTAEGASTRLDLHHRGWERFAEEAAERRSGYDSGWKSVLAYFTKAMEDGT